MLPMFILITLFHYIPLAGWSMAFKDYQLGNSIFSGEFVGLKEFKTFFIDAQDALYVIRNTLVINLRSLFINLTTACAFSIIVSEAKITPLRHIIQSGFRCKIAVLQRDC